MRESMILTNFRSVLRNFHQAKELCSGLQSLVPAASVTGQHTCRTTAAVFSYTPYKDLHTKCNGLVSSQSLCMQQKHYIRKLYPDPMEQDPEYYMLPEEETQLDLNYVPHLGHQGPELVAKVHESVKGDMGRLFAVVHIGGEQRKVTTEDMVLINGFFPPQIGDKIRLEKVMLVGGKDFTLFGRPLLNRDLVQVKATVIEKTLSHVRVNFTKYKRRRILKLHQYPQSVIVINSIEIDPAALS